MKDFLLHGDLFPWGLLLASLLVSYGASGILGRIFPSCKKQLTRAIFLTLSSGLWMGAAYYFDFSGHGVSVGLTAARVVLTIGLSFFAYSLVDVFFLFIAEEAKKSTNKIDDVLVPLFRKASKVVVALLGLFFVGDALSFNMKNLIAGLGIGGLAFAFAAKDTIANLFGSLTLILDRPFGVGDWVKIDGDLEGTVVEVGIRSTRVRTFYDSVIAIPNGHLANVHIDNYGQRTYRRLSTKISIEYSTPPEKIEAFCEGIRQIIATHKWTRKNYFHVYLNELASSSLDILLYVFWQVPSWSKELAERHRLLLDVLRLGKELGIEFAFPTRTLHLFNEEKRGSEDISVKTPPHLMGVERAEKVLKHPLSFKNERSGLQGNRLPDDDISL